MIRAANNPGPRRPLFPVAYSANTEMIYRLLLTPDDINYGCNQCQLQFRHYLTNRMSGARLKTV